MLKLFLTAESGFSLLALLAAFGLAALATPFARRLALLCDCLDVPDGKRKLHKVPVPYFGGLAILGGFVVSVLLFEWLTVGSIPRAVEVMAVGGMLIALVGLLDDMYSLHPLLKLLCQVAVSTGAAFFGGTVDYFTLFGKTITLGVFAVPLTVFWMVLIINAVNLIDGLDGLASGVTALMAFALFITSAVMENPVCMVASAALCGAALGFLPFNANHATIFMGDAGSMLIGYVLACISVFGLFKAQALFSIVVPALIFAVPLLDTVTAFFRRLLHGQSPFRADRAHLHHRLIDNGFTPKQSVLLIYCASAVFCYASILFMKYKVLSVLLVCFDLVFLEIMKNKKKIACRFGKKKPAAPEEEPPRS